MEPGVEKPIVDQVVENYPIIGLGGEPTGRVGSRTLNFEQVGQIRVFTWRDNDGRAVSASEVLSLLNSGDPLIRKRAEEEQIGLKLTFNKIKKQLKR